MPAGSWAGGLELRPMRVSSSMPLNRPSMGPYPSPRQGQQPRRVQPVVVTFDYRAIAAQWHAGGAAKRPKISKRAIHPVLRDDVQDRLSGLIATPDGIAFDRPVVVSKGGALVIGKAISASAVRDAIAGTIALHPPDFSAQYDRHRQRKGLLQKIADMLFNLNPCNSAGLESKLRSKPRRMKNMRLSSRRADLA